MNIFMLCEKLCRELDPLVTSITLNEEDQITGDLQFSFILECYDWATYSFEKYNLGSLAKRYFEITCTDCIESSVIVGGFSDIVITDEHPLLFKYKQAQVELYFSSAPINPYEVLGRLVEAHQKSYQDWRPLTDCINENLIETLQGGFGLLAKGPKVIMDAYYNVTSDLLKLKRIENDFSKKPQLLLLSSGYIICRDVSIKELKRLEISGLGC